MIATSGCFRTCHRLVFLAHVLLMYVDDALFTQVAKAIGLNACLLLSFCHSNKLEKITTWPFRGVYRGGHLPSDQKTAVFAGTKKDPFSFTSAQAQEICLLSFFLLFRRHATLDRERMLHYSQYRTRHTQPTQNCTHSAMPTMPNRNCSREGPGCGLHTVAKEDGKAGNCGNTRSSLPSFKDQRRRRKSNMTRNNARHASPNCEINGAEPKHQLAGARTVGSRTRMARPQYRISST